MISIIVTTYNNDHKFLKTALSSCLCQDIEKEIILVDDGSRVEINQYTKELIKINGIKYIKHHTNQGLSAARNTGILNSKYEYYITLDSDDFFFDNALTEMMGYIDGKHDVYFANLWNSAGNGRESIPLGYLGITKKGLLEENQLWCSSVVRKKVWEKVGGYLVKECPHYEDWNFWCRVYKHKFKFKYIPICLYQHTSRPESMLSELHHEKQKYRLIATQDLI